MKPVEPQQMPGFTKYPHRRWLYVPCFAKGKVREILDGVADAVIQRNPNANCALIEEGALITLPSGETLQGVSFKTVHAEVEHAIEQYAADHCLLLGELDGATLRLADGRAIELDACVCERY
jgi:hypothetical protein